ncbi:NTP pyrophosphohydrolase [Frondihabitans sp. PAMC 28766]|uniref:NUDIX domain-containing protein n=1 Tax=Frondihabitans sp. PAMC 28766 TaxID=1795630 RepID=UPI00078DB76C|nr:NUDIX domain-containing protein [Frondihabitans sp. PAMC 28766]AMM20706.1 NTP pyrophosphohydrolase [Frondihabitans sp. PAMC 28766]
MTIHGPADGWVALPDGRKFWGKAGAAGLLVVDASSRILLQHRVEWSHFGGTWGIPGGARQFDESAVEGALRESAEEAAVPRDALRLLFTSVVDLGVWSYTTVVARATTPFEPVISDRESEALEWVLVDGVDELPLHPGFASSWAKLRPLIGQPLHLVVDSANVVGSRPDGWWRDRAGATDRLRSGLEALALAGVPAAAVAADPDAGLDTWWPEISLVVEGRATGAQDPDAFSRVRLVRAAADGDSAVVDEVVSLVGSARVVVVTADRELRSRVEAAGAATIGPAALLDLLP